MYGSAPPRYGPPQGQDRFAAQAPPQRPPQRPPVRPPEPVDFLVGMVVRLTGGAKAGRLAVLTEPADQVRPALLLCAACVLMPCPCREDTPSAASAMAMAD